MAPAERSFLDSDTFGGSGPRQRVVEHRDYSAKAPGRPRSGELSDPMASMLGGSQGHSGSTVRFAHESRETDLLSGRSSACPPTRLPPTPVPAQTGDARVASISSSSSSSSGSKKKKKKSNHRHKHKKEKQDKKRRKRESKKARKDAKVRKPKKDKVHA